MSKCNQPDRSQAGEPPVLDVLVVGAGQAGLAAGYWLKQSGASYLLVDGASRIGDSWRQRWDSLTLFTPAAYSALPGLPWRGDRWSYPTKDEMADYLEGYARHFALPLRLGDGVERLERVGDVYAATLSSGTRLGARAVIVAAGAFQVPAVPGFAAELHETVVQLTANSYRNPSATPAGTVLIVGDGATGRQVAAELSETRRVLLATGRPRRATPEKILGRSIFWWLDRLGVLRVSRNSRIGRRLMETDPFPGRHLRLGPLAARGVVIKPRVESVAGRRVTFTDGTREDISAVIWSTGYRDETGWMVVPGAVGRDGRFAHSEGVSPVAGLYHVGRNWQRTRGSALVLGVGEDARQIVAAVGRYLSAELARPVVQAAAAGILQGSMSTTQPPDVTRLTDPVCGMSVRLDAAQLDGLTLDHHGTLYAFCRAACRDAFVADPHHFAQAEPPAAGVAEAAHAHGGGLPVIDEGMRRWYESCSCCLGDAYPAVKAALDAERREQARAPAGEGICEVAEAEVAPPARAGLVEAPAEAR